MADQLTELTVVIQAVLCTMYCVQGTVLYYYYYSGDEPTIKNLFHKICIDIKAVRSYL